jgi:hypothetical protein
MIKRKKKIGCETPEFRKSTAPPMPTVAKPKPNYTPPPSVPPVRMSCTYETPCGWCTKWDKKCNKKIGRKKDKDLEDIKSGKGLASACVFREPWRSIVP